MRDGGPDVEGGLGIAGPRELGDVRRFSHEAMATSFEVYAVHPDERYAAQAAQAAFELTDRLERELSRFVPNSDITRVNHLVAGEGARVGPSTMECLVIARHLFDLTGGAFDPSIGTGLASLELDADDFMVRATIDGVQIDLGAIGKGYAVDLMAELLEEWGLQHALVHGGFSSVLALEPPPGRDGWPLTLSDPGAPSRVLARLSVCQTALGASGVRKGDHIVDPRTGEPARGRKAAWVALPRPARAGAEASAEGPRMAAAAVTDALTTAMMLLSIEEIAALCERSPGLEAWVLPESVGGPPGEADLIYFGGRL
ncbi:MAG: FAD:protein FMN transferase [Vicinamibacteria bacterium]|nr:FAD:protein FMN transferase [Vicinamibacteria bacterium]